MRISDCSSDVCSSDLNPYGMALVAALICYPPFILMNGGPLDYQIGGSDWGHWFAGHDMLMALWGAVLVALIAVYAWATMAFGIRFSNLTHRGVITHGPYAFTRHPAYVSKNLSRSEEHTSELQSLMRNSYAVFCLKKKTNN